MAASVLPKNALSFETITLEAEQSFERVDHCLPLRLRVLHLRKGTLEVRRDHHGDVHNALSSAVLRVDPAERRRYVKRKCRR